MFLDSFDSPFSFNNNDSSLFRLPDSSPRKRADSLGEDTEEIFSSIFSPLRLPQEPDASEILGENVHQEESHRRSFGVASSSILPLESDKPQIENISALFQDVIPSANQSIESSSVPSPTPPLSFPKPIFVASYEDLFVETAPSSFVEKRDPVKRLPNGSASKTTKKKRQRTQTSRVLNEEDKIKIALRKEKNRLSAQVSRQAKKKQLDELLQTREELIRTASWIKETLEPSLSYPRLLLSEQDSLQFLRSVPEKIIELQKQIIQSEQLIKKLQERSLSLN